MFAPEVGKTIAGRYRLARRVGEGGMGSVWAAHDDKLRRDVAIKLVTERIADSERALARFEREAMSIARLRSPYITQVYDYGVEEGSPYIIMELLDGEDLKEVLARDKQLSMDQTARVVVQVAKALHAAHESGIVHRDLKPANVFIASEHGEQVCKVFDFGVAKALNDLADDGDTTAEGVLLGTPRYMSPEQAHGAKRVDHRTDLWSLGVIAYLCLAGRLPFVAAGTGHVLVKICTEEPPPPSQFNDALPLEVDAFMARALAKEPEDRFQTAREMGTAFAELADQSLSSFGSSSPSWEGMSRGRLSSPSMSEEHSAPSLGDISYDASMPDLSGMGMSHGDGTLGPAVTSARPSWLGSRRARVGVGAIALLGVGIGAGVLLTRTTTKSEDGRAATEPSPATRTTGVSSTSRAAAAPAPGDAQRNGSSAGSGSAKPAASTASTEAERGDSRPTSRGPTSRGPTSRGPTSRGPTSRGPAPTEAEPNPVEPAPTSKTEPKSPKPQPPGDGLDLFDKRF